MPETFYTEKEYRELGRKYESVHYVLHRICQEREKKVNGVNKKYYAYIPNSTYRVIKELHLVLGHLRKKDNYRTPNFLDVGSGIGMIMELAKRDFASPSGIEVDKKLIEEQKSLFGQQSIGNVHNGDALKYKEYNKYDVIYYYVPIEDKELERKLERRIERQMKVGAILIANSKVDLQIQKSKKFKRLFNGHPIYEKIRK